MPPGAQGSWPRACGLAPTTNQPGTPTRTEPVGLILAAGQGRRFGGDKLLAPLEGRPLLAHLLDTVEAATRKGMLAGSLTVLPAGDERLIILARAHGSRVIENDAPALGLSRSLRLGLAALAESAAGAALILLGDEPRVRLETIARVIDAWHRKPGGIVRPRYADQPGAPGHPLLIDRAGWRLARALEGDSGLGPILRSHPELVTTVDLEGSNPDVDTTDDLYSLEEPH